MRKHFLLLFLMALLPLAGWAESVTVTLYDFTVPYGTALSVNTLPGDAVKVEAATATWSDIKEFLTFSSPECTAAEGHVGTYSYTLTKAATTGSYTIYLSSNNAKVTIAQATNAITTAPAVIGAHATWTGNDINLLSTEGVAKFGTVEYSIDGGTNWAAGMPKAKDAGTYAVQAKVVGNDNYTSIAAYVVGDATIDGAAITAADFTAPQAKTGLKYTGVAQDLITTGSATGVGKMVYRIGATGAFSEATPKGTEAGSYTVYWMIEGDNSHNDYAGGNFDVVIGQGDPEISTVPAVITGFTYDGAEHAIINTNGAATLGANITYQLQKKNGTSWDNEGAATTTPASLKIKGAGEYRVEYSVAGDVNLNAVAAAQTASVTIAKAPLTVSVKGCSKVYGEADPTFEVVYSGFVGSENKSNLSTQAAAGRDAGENAGYYALTFTTQATSANYEITHNTSNYLLINPKPLVAADVDITLGTAPTYDGTPKEADITAVKFFTNAVTAYNVGTGLGDYTVSYDGTSNINAGDAAKVTITGKNNYTGSVVKNFTIGKAPIYVWPVAASKTYGETDPAFTYILGNNTGVENTAASLGNTPTISRKPGENVGTYKMYLSAYTAATGDNYAVQNVGDETTCIALFTINAKTDNVLKLKFKADIADARKTKVYDGNTNVVFYMDDLTVEEGLLGNDDWDVVKNNLGSPVFALASKDAGQTTVGVTGLGSLNYPTVTVEPLAFEVTKKPLAVKVNPQTLDYATPITSAETTNWELATGYVYATGESNTEAGIVLYTEQDITLYAPGSTNANAIKAKVPETSNYKIADSGNTWGTLNINAASGLILYSDADDLDKITAFNGQTKPVSISFANRNSRELPAGTARPWKAQTWVTMTLPFDISVAKLSEKLGYAIVNVIDPSRTEISGTGSKFYGKLTMTGGNGKNDVLAANKPFMVKTANAITGVVDFGSQLIVAPDPTDADALTVDAGHGAKFTGTYTAKNVSKADQAAIWFLLGNSDNWSYIKSTSNAEWNILPFEGFIDMSHASAPAGAHNMTFYFEELDGSTTAIKSINADDLNGKMAAEGMYNLNGMKLNTVPTQKGIYILNGKKVVIK